MERKQVPVYLLTGFLGAGKTTVLKALLRELQGHGRRPAVLMNEFGAVSVDTQLLGDALVPVVDLVEGCVCCTVRGSLTQGLEQLLHEHAPDVVLLEATGVANPVEVVDALLDLPLAHRIALAGVVTCVDATQFPLHVPPPYLRSALQETMVEQVRHADVLVVTKTDIAPFERVIGVESVLRELNGQAMYVTPRGRQVDAGAILQVRQGSRGGKLRLQREPRGLREQGEQHVQRGQLDPFDRLDPRVRRFQRPPHGGVPRRVIRKVADDRTTSFGRLRTMQVAFPRPLDADKLYEWLHRLPASVLRAKGVFREAELGVMCQFHYVPGVPVVESCEWLEGCDAFAVVIGEDLDEAALLNGLHACE